MSKLSDERIKAIMERRLKAQLLDDKEQTKDDDEDEKDFNKRIKKLKKENEEYRNKKEEVAQQNYSFKNQAKEIHEQEQEFYKRNKELDKKIAEIRKNKNKKVPMSTKKITKRVLPEVHKDLDKYVKDFDLTIDKSLKPKKKLMTTTKIYKPVKKTTMKTAKIVEYKPKEHELNKVIELLGELKQTSPIINAKKYVKNFIKNN
jgi:chromosome segregation ATPase